MAFSAQVFNEIVAQALFDGNTGISGMFLTVLISVILVFLLYNIAPNTSSKMMLVPFILVALITTALGWIDTMILVIIILVSGFIIASVGSERFSG